MHNNNAKSGISVYELKVSFKLTSPGPSPKSKSQVQAKSQIQNGKRNLDSVVCAVSKIPQLLSMKEASRYKTQRIKVTQHDAL